MPMATVMTTKAPKSGSSSSSPPTTSHGAEHGQEGLLQSCITAILRTV